MNSIGLYFRYILASFKSQMRYPMSFMLSAAASLLVTVIDFVAVFSFFHRFGALGEWSLHQVAMFYGSTHMAFALSEAYMRGFDTFQHQVQAGDFDRILLRPRTTFLQMLGSQCQLRRVGRFLNGIVPFIWGFTSLGLRWPAHYWALFALAILGGSMLYSGIILLQATTCFWTISSLEVFNMFTYGGVETNQYPLSIYTKWFMRFFCFVLPLACVNYWPMSLLLGKGYVPAAVSWVSPLVGPAFFGIGMLVWRFGVKHYHSTGS